MRKFVLSFIVLLLCLPALAGVSAHEEGEIIITGAWARPTVGAAEGGMGNMQHNSEGHSGMAMGSGFPSAFYMTIENAGDHPIGLVSASTPLAMTVEIHETTVVDNVARMNQLEDGLVIPAGETAVLQPGGLHIMLLDLMRDIAVGEAVALDLTFEMLETDAEPMVIRVGAIAQDFPNDPNLPLVAESLVFDATSVEMLPHSAAEMLDGVTLPEGSLAMIRMLNTSEVDAPLGSAMFMDAAVPLYALIDGELMEIDEYDLGVGEAVVVLAALGEVDAEAFPNGALPVMLGLTDERSLAVGVPFLGEMMHGEHSHG